MVLLILLLVPVISWHNLVLYFTIRKGVVVDVITLTFIGIINIIGVFLDYLNIATMSIGVIDVYDVVILDVLLQAFV